MQNQLEETRESSYAPISDDWRRWIAENKLLGVSDEQLVAELVRHGGVDAGLATQEVRAVTEHPYFQAGEQMAQRLRKLESLLDVRRSLSSLASGSDGLERRGRISREEFLERYYSANRPVILTGLLEDWPAASWNPAYLKEVCGDATVEIVSGRDRDPRYEINSVAHKTHVRFGDYVDMVTQEGESNDYYLVANNGFFGRPEAKRLYEDLRSLPEYLDPAKAEGRVFLWFGPAGTVTPLHHDVMNVFLAQVYGRKQVTLISPDQTPRVYNQIGVYSEVDCENPDYQKYPLFRQVEPLRIILQPGEVLFLPVGWWHHVKALDVSITVTFINFIHQNDFDWSHPHFYR